MFAKTSMKKVLNEHIEAKENMEKSKERNKAYHDKRYHAKGFDIKEGDICLQKTQMS